MAQHAREQDCLHHQAAETSYLFNDKSSYRELAETAEQGKTSRDGNWEDFMSLQHSRDMSSRFSSITVLQSAK